jgi:hypothetical protein
MRTKQLLQTTVTLAMPVRPHEERDAHRTYFHEFRYFIFFQKSVDTLRIKKKETATSLAYILTTCMLLSFIIEILQYEVRQKKELTI